MDSELYWCGSAEAIDPLGREDCELDTPLGVVALSAEIGGERITEAVPAAAFRVGRGGRLLVWDSEAFRAELLITRPMVTEERAGRGDCFAAMWRVRARRDLDPCTFACSWDAPPGVVPQGPSPGEALEAIAWWGRGLSLVIGTEDAEMLAARASRGEGLPPAWSERLAEPVWPYLDGGLIRTLPPLAAGELCQLHFVVAWTEEDEEGVDSWLAVDCMPAAILGGANCA